MMPLPASSGPIDHGGGGSGILRARSSKAGLDGGALKQDGSGAASDRGADACRGRKAAKGW